MNRRSLFRSALALLVATLVPWRRKPANFMGINGITPDPWLTRARITPTPYSYWNWERIYQAADEGALVIQTKPGKHYWTSGKPWEPADPA